MNQLILGMILSVLPISELRGGLPLAVNYALENNVPILPVFLLILISNIIVIFLIFFFLDFLHESFMKLPPYRKTFDFFLRRIRKRAEKIEKKMSIYGFLALTFFVAIPLPVTGAWTGCLIAWVLGLDRKKSIGAIGLGVVIAGAIVLLGSLGVISLFRFL